MAFGLMEGIGLAGSLFGMFGGRKSSREDKTRRAASSKMGKIVEGFDQGREDEFAVQQAKADAQFSLERALGNVLAQFSAAGGNLAGIDTSRAGIMRGVSSDINRQLATYLAQLRATRSQRALQTLAIAMGTNQKDQPKDLSGVFNLFGKTLDRIFAK